MADIHNQLQVEKARQTKLQDKASAIVQVKAKYEEMEGEKSEA